MSEMPDQNNTLLYLSRTDVVEVGRSLDVVALLKDVFRLHATGQTVLPEEAYLSWSNRHNERSRSLGMPAYVGGAFCAAGTKVINGNPHNIERGLPRADGLTLIFDPDSARISCIMEGAYLSGLRTAGVTMLATELLGGAAIECVAILGAGALAQSHLELIPKYLRTVRRILVFDIRPQRAAELLRKNSDRFRDIGVIIQVVENVEAAIREADLIIPVTTTTQSYLRYDWLKSGCLLVNISLDDPEPEIMLRAELLVVDDWNLIRDDDKRLLGRMFREGRIVGPNHTEDKTTGARAVDAELGDLVLGKKPGRISSEDIIVVNPFGLAIEDVALGARIYEIARTRGLGIQIER